MNGDELYERYVAAMAARNVLTDEWEELDEMDKEAWNEIAAGLTVAQRRYT